MIKYVFAVIGWDGAALAQRTQRLSDRLQSRLKSPEWPGDNVLQAATEGRNRRGNRPGRTVAVASSILRTTEKLGALPLLYSPAREGSR